MYSSYASEQNKPTPCARGNDSQCDKQKDDGKCPRNGCSGSERTVVDTSVQSRCPMMAQLSETLAAERAMKSVTPQCVDSQSVIVTSSTNNQSQNSPNKCCKCNCGRKSSMTKTGSDTLLKQDGSAYKSPVRKTSNISMVSSSGGSDETEGEKKLDLRGLIESVGTLLIPVVSLSACLFVCVCVCLFVCLCVCFLFCFCFLFWTTLQKT